MFRNNLMRLMCAAPTAFGVFASVAAAQPSQFHVNTKGSLFIVPSVELRWDQDGVLIQDTYIQLHNDASASVQVQLFFVNGDPPLPADGNERPHPGWNWVDSQIELTSNQPSYWSVSTGLGAGGPIDPVVAPFTILDPGTPPGRPDPEGSSERVLRGFIMGWAVNVDNKEIKWDHLEATATVVNFRDGGAYGYNAYHAQVVNPNVSQGQESGTPGTLNLDDAEYAAPYDRLMFNFAADNSTLYSAPTAPITVRSDLTLMPASVDVRQQTSGPILTKADFRVWNMNELQFSGMFRCVQCWDQTTFAQYSVPNHFPLAMLQTPVGWAEVDGTASQLCDQNPGDSVPAALIGIVSKQLDIDFITEYAGYNLLGRGSQPSTIRYDVQDGPPELSANGRVFSSGDRVDTNAQSAHRAAAAVEDPRRHRVEPTVETARDSARNRGVSIDLHPDSRMSASKPGNLVYVSKVALGWDAQDHLRRDTFIHLTNTGSDPVKVRMYFVNGDDIVAGNPGEPGWNTLEVEIDLTPRQPIYWSAANGDAGRSIPSFVDLDPGPPPGRPFPNGQHERELRGFIVAWAVNESCEEIAGNVLMADAIIVDHGSLNTAWGYTGYHLPNVAAVPFGEPSGTPGVLELNGSEYPPGFEQLIFTSPSHFSNAYSVGAVNVLHAPDVTLHQLSGDFTPSAPGPLTSKADYHVWNTNELKFSGMFRCITCWNQDFLGNYGIPNHFVATTLQSPLGAARINGIASSLCDDANTTSEAASMQGLIANFLRIDGSGPSPKFAWAGHQMFGMGSEDAVVRGVLCPTCPWDIATAAGPGMDGDVNVFDLLELLANWGTNGPGADIAPPTNIVDVFDLLELLAHWGPCP